MEQAFGFKHVERLIKCYTVKQCPPLAGMAEIGKIEAVVADIFKTGERCIEFGLDACLLIVVAVALHKTVIATMPLAENIYAIVELCWSNLGQETGL